MGPYSAGDWSDNKAGVDWLHTVHRMREPSRLGTCSLVREDRKATV